MANEEYYTATASVLEDDEEQASQQEASQEEVSEQSAASPDVGPAEDKVEAAKKALAANPAAKAKAVDVVKAKLEALGVKDNMVPFTAFGFDGNLSVRLSAEQTDAMRRFLMLPGLVQERIVREAVANGGKGISFESIGKAEAALERMKNGSGVTHFGAH